MRNFHVRRRANNAKAGVSNNGISYRKIEHGENIGQVARMRIGEGATATIVTLEQQPGHNPVAFQQKVRYSPGNVWAYQYKPSGDGTPLKGDQVREMINDAIASRVTPVDVAHLAVVNLFFPEQ